MNKIIKTSQKLKDRMQLVDSILLSFALGVDAAIVAFAIGISHPDKSHRPGLKLALWFGAFQSLMSACGWLIADKIEIIRPWAQKGSGAVFIILGLKLIWDAWHDTDAPASVPETHHAHLVLAVATSLDALAAGVGLVSFEAAIWVIVLIGLVAFLMTLIGALASHRFRKFPERYLELLGGAILFFLGVKNFV
ncbi:MAG: manganese efflux pump MntP family protein [Bacteriovoracaceae bacterium]|nr:manganese efflux pump MntP family protein [Bacteriovoracaceae bacterium]